MSKQLQIWSSIGLGGSATFDEVHQLVKNLFPLSQNISIHNKYEYTEYVSFTPQVLNVLLALVFVATQPR